MRGIRCFVSKDDIPSDSVDPVVISKAEELDSILISWNGDFSDIVAYPPAVTGGIVALQVRNHPEVIPEIMSLLVSHFSAHSEMAHDKGKLFVVEAHRIRIGT